MRSSVPILQDINFVQYQFLLYGMALVLMMLFRPEGLFPSQRRKRELHTADAVTPRPRRPTSSRRARCDGREPAGADAPAANELPIGDADDRQLLLSARNITKRFGGLIAVNDVSFDIPEGSIVSLIGPNGAGKTTFFNIIAGIYDPTGGRIVVPRPDDDRPSRSGPGSSRSSGSSRRSSSGSCSGIVVVQRERRRSVAFLGGALTPRRPVIMLVGASPGRPCYQRLHRPVRDLPERPPERHGRRPGSAGPSRTSASSRT